MKVNFFEGKRWVEEQSAELEAAVREVIHSQSYILGAQGRHFEQELKAFLAPDSAGGVLGCNSGTDALILALLAADIGDGDEVIAPALTAIPTITAIRSTGATPVFADIDANHWLIDFDHTLEKVTTQTKAIIVVQLYGAMADCGELRRRLEKIGREDILIVEDVAQAMGSALRDKQAGTLGDVGTYSFYPTKNIGALGDAGAVFTESTEFIDRISMLRNYGQRDRYNAITPRGLNSRLDEMQAAILRVRLPKLKEWTRIKASLMDGYRAALKSSPLRFQSTHPELKAAWHLCAVAAPDAGVREHLMEHLQKNGVQTLIHYPIPCHLQAAFQEFSEGKGSLPHTESLANRVFSLPLTHFLLPSEQQHVIEKIRDFEAW